MNAIFISYRRRETQDIVGRVFDRLHGYFGPDAVLLDVDALVAGGNYREQIRDLIAHCSVVLAVIGREWLTVTDDSGPRLANPDDQLRIELETAFAQGTMVIPVMVHDAQLPTAAELPESLQPLAACEPHFMQGGPSFNSDVHHLIVRLQDTGIVPAEARIPWHTVLMTAGVLLLLSVSLTAEFRPPGSIDDFVMQQLDPAQTLSEIKGHFMRDSFYDQPFVLEMYDRLRRFDLAFFTLPLTLGPMLIVWGSRKCCLNKERVSSRAYYARGSGRLPMPKSSKSVLCLALGVASFGGGLWTALPAVALAAWAWIELRGRSTWMRGRSLIVFGLLAAAAGVFASDYLILTSAAQRSWLARMEAAYAAKQRGDEDASLSNLQAALKYANRFTATTCHPVAITHIRLADCLGSQNKLAEAVAELTRAVEDIETDTPPSRGYTPQDDETVWSLALQRRSELYESLGEPEQASRDLRLRQGGLGRRDQTLNELEEEEHSPQSPAPPDADTAPMPPAPVVDPSVRSHGARPEGTAVT